MKYKNSVIEYSGNKINVIGMKLHKNLSINIQYIITRGILLVLNIKSNILLIKSLILNFICDNNFSGYALIIKQKITRIIYQLN